MQRCSPRHIEDKEVAVATTFLPQPLFTLRSSQCIFSIIKVSAAKLNYTGIIELAESMATCSVAGCNSCFYNKPNFYKNLQFFCFPRKDPELCAQWVKAIGKDNWMPLRWSKICSLHFTERDYMPGFEGRIKYLKTKAVPSQMLGTPSNSETEESQNSSMADTQSVTVSLESNVETAETVQTNLRPIALIRVVHKGQNPVTNKKQTGQTFSNEKNPETGSILPHKVSKVVTKIKTEVVSPSPQKLSSELGNQEETEGDSILPHEVSHSLCDQEQTELGSRLPQKVSQSVDDGIKTEGINTLPDEVSKSAFNDMETESESILPDKESNSIINEIESILPHKVSNSVIHEKRTETTNISPQNVSNLIGSRSAEPINRLTRKRSDAVANNRKDWQKNSTERVKVSRNEPITIDDEERSEIIKIVPCPPGVLTKSALLKMRKRWNDKKAEPMKPWRFSPQTMDVVSVAGSDPKSVLCDQKQTELGSRLPHKVSEVATKIKTKVVTTSSQKVSSELGNEEQKEPDSILPHEVSNSFCDQNQTELSNRLPHKESDAVGNKIKAKAANVSPQKVSEAVDNEMKTEEIYILPDEVTKSTFIDMETESESILPDKESDSLLNENEIELESILPHKVSDSVINERRTETTDPSPQNVSNLIGSKSAEPINRLTRKRSDAVANNRKDWQKNSTERVKVFRNEPIMIADVDRSGMIKIVPCPPEVYSNETKSELSKMRKRSNEKKTEPTKPWRFSNQAMNVVPVAGSDPKLALCSQKQTESGRRLPHKVSEVVTKIKTEVTSPQKVSSQLDNEDQKEPDSILPHEVSNSFCDQKQTELRNRLPHKESDAVGNKIKTKAANVSPQKVSESADNEMKTEEIYILRDEVTKSAFNDMETESESILPEKESDSHLNENEIESESILPHKVSNSVINERRTATTDISPQNISILVGGKSAEPINKLTRKRSDAVANNKKDWQKNSTERVKVFRNEPIMIADVDRSGMIKIVPCPPEVYSNETKSELSKMRKRSNEKKAEPTKPWRFSNQTMNVVPVAGSDPKLALCSQKQTESGRRLPHKVSEVVAEIKTEVVTTSPQKVFSQLGNEEQMEPDSILPHEVSDSFCDQNQTELSSRLPHKVSDSVGDKIKTEAANVSPQKVPESADNEIKTEEIYILSDEETKPAFNDMETESESILPDKESDSLINKSEIESGSILAHKASNSVTNKKKAETTDTSSQKVPNLVGNKPAKRAYRLQRNRSDAVAKNRKHRKRVKIPNIVLNAIVNEEKSGGEKIKIVCPPRVYSNKKKSEVSKISLLKRLTEKKNEPPKPWLFSHHTMDVEPVAKPDSLCDQIQTELGSRLPSKVSDAVVRKMKTKAVDVSPRKASDSVDNGENTEDIIILSDNETNSDFDYMETESHTTLADKESDLFFTGSASESDRILPHKVSRSVIDKKRTEANKISPKNVSNSVGNKSAEPMNRLSCKVSDSVSHFRIEAIADEKRSRMVKILPRPTHVCDSNKKANECKILLHKKLYENKPDPRKSSRFSYHTMRVVPVAGSYPILAIQCPLNNQETYVKLPAQCFTKKDADASSTEVDEEKTTEDQKSPDKSEDPEQVLKQKENVSESTKIERLQKEILRLHQRLLQQKRRLQSAGLMQRSKRGHKRNGENS